MQKAEEKLIDEKFKSVIAMINTNNKIGKIYHKELLESQKTILDQVLLTNGRVNKLEKGTRFFRWAERNPKTSISLSVVLFFGFIGLGSFLGWDYILTKIL